MTPTNSPAAQPQGGELLPCRVCGSVPVKSRWFREEGAVHCSKTTCFMFNRAMDKAEWEALMAPADLPRATAGSVRKLTLPELNHLMALLEAEKESGEYAGPREQYYARTERLITWCQEQIDE